jgi:chitodextrinase
VTGDGRPSTRRHFQLDIRDDATGKIRTIDGVPGGQNASSYTVQESQFPAPPPGRSFSYRVRTSEWSCTGGSPGLNTCTEGHENRYSDYSPWVGSVQDAAAPVVNLLALAGNAPYTSSLQVQVRVDATDPGPRASGLGYLQIGTQAQLGCPKLGVCTRPFTPVSTATLAPGPDGLRFVYARVFDLAQAPGSGRVLGDSFGPPAGNVSQVAMASITLDTTSPKLAVSRSPEPQKAGKPVTFDGSQSVDAPGPNADTDSGVDAGTAVWDFGDGVKSSGLIASHSYAAAGSYRATFTLADRAGNTSTLTIPVTIMPSDWGGTGSPTQTTTTPATVPPTVDVTAPALGGLRLTRSGARLRLRLSLSEPATVVVRVERVRPRPRVVLFARSVSRAAGPTTLVLGRVNPRLKRARYRVLVAARDAAGNVSPTRAVATR